MKVLDVAAFGGCLTSLATASLTLEKRTSPSVVAFPIQRRLVTPEQSGHHERADIRIPLTNHHYYTHDVSLTLGTPPQQIQALLDTGSSGLLVYAPNSDRCKEDKSVCQFWGSYNVNKSSTYNFLNHGMQASYLSGEQTLGDYATDILQIGPIKVQKMQIGIMYQTNISENVLGVGYTVAKNIVDPMIDDTPHENLPSLLVKQKYIESRAFSLWLNDLNTPSGEILFGGVDTEKYQGDLVTLPFVERVREMVIDFSIVLNNVQMTDSKGATIDLPTKPTPLYALIDSGSSQTVLPDDIVLAIYDKLGANLTNPERPTVNCSMIKNTTTVDFVFDNSLTIKVPLSQLIFPAKEPSQCPLWGLGKTSQYPFNTIILGSSFLSSAYAVFDLDNREVSIAQSKSNPKSSKVLQIASGGHAVPGVKKTWSGNPAVGKTINDWQYLGCAKETAPRTLNSATFVSANMTIESCQAFCGARNYRVAGVQYAKECFCGNVLSNGGAVGALGCNMPCKGNPNEICGGRNHISIFDDISYEPISNPPIVNGFGYFGCFQEKSKGRLLSGPFTANDTSMTAETCTAFCHEQDRSLVWAGMQFGRECFCSPSLPSSAAPAPENSCDMICSGNKKEYCGGSRLISLYKLIDSA